jgi:hypothetical protein
MTPFFTKNSTKAACAIIVPTTSSNASRPWSAISFLPGQNHSLTALGERVASRS